MPTKTPDNSSRLTLVSKPVRVFSGVISSYKAIIVEHELIRSLIGRELKARYKDSFLGFFWSLMRPLVQLLIYYVAIGQFLGAARAIPDFALFIFSGLTIWGVFQETMSRGTISIIQNAGLVKKIFIPREIFPIAVTGGAIVNLGIQLFILVLATVVLDAPPSMTMLIPGLLGLLLILIFSLASALVLSAMTVYFRDLEHLIEITLLILFWASPIVYSYSFVYNAIGGTFIETIYLSNPLTLAVLGFQKTFWTAGSQDPNQYWPPDLDLRLVVAIILSTIFLFFAQRLFEKLQGNFAQEL